jgi:hemerythrin
MASAWQDNLSVGDENIDNQHQELFQLTMMLDTAIKHQSINELNEIICFLETYVIHHYQDEEALMKAHSFKGYHHHKQDHDVFKTRVVALRYDFDNNPSKTHLIFKIRQFIDKLIHHVRTVDIEISNLERKQP